MANKGNPLIFKDAEIAKEAIMASQKKEIAELYEKWADEIGDKAYYYAMKSNASAPLSEKYYRELQKQLRATSQNISNEIYSKIKNNMYIISDAVIKDNVKWLESLGFDKNGLNAAFSYVPDEIVRNLVTGQIYDSGWSLSARIWGDNEATLKDIYQVMAKGLAENKPIYQIAKDLEAYVRPSAQLPWNLRMADGVKIYKKQIDYNAQRLARTLAQHSYQQSFIATTQKNPFITEYIWRSNGSRVCELCSSRDGKHFKKDELPMDHPNGMCTMEPAVAEDMVDQLANWFNSPDGTYPEIDEFASNFGYNASKSDVKTTLDFVNKYGLSTKSPSAWFNSLTPTQKAEAKLLKEQSGLTWNEWYEQNIHSTGDANLDFAKKWGTSDKSPNAWFNSLSATQKAEAKLLKEQSGLTWNEWYTKYVYSGDGSNIGGKTKVVKAFTDVQDKFLSPYGFTPDNMPVDFDDWSHKVSHAQASDILQSMGTSWGDPHPYQQLKKYYDANLVSSNLTTKTVKVTASSTKTAKVVQASGKVPDTASWFSKIKSQSERHMLELEQDFLKKLGDAGIKGIQRYSGSSYGSMNSYLRYLQQGYSEADAISMSGISPDKLKNVKDAIKGLSKTKLPEDLVLRRGTDLGDLAGLFMQGDFTTNKRSLYGKTPEELNQMFAGAIGKYGAFTSTSSIWDRGFSDDVEIILYAPKGTSASSIMSISNFGTGEGETLLNAGTTVRCVKIEQSDGHKYSKIRVFLEILTN